MYTMYSLKTHLAINLMTLLILMYTNQKPTLTHTGLAILCLLVALVTEASKRAQSVLTEAMRATERLIEPTLINVWRTKNKEMSNNSFSFNYLFHPFLSPLCFSNILFYWWWFHCITLLIALLCINICWTNKSWLLADWTTLTCTHSTYAAWSPIWIPGLNRLMTTCAIETVGVKIRRALNVFNKARQSDTHKHTHTPSPLHTSWGSEQQISLLV